MPVDILFKQSSGFVLRCKQRKIFKLDYLANQLGYEVVRLLLHHYKCNPIEIWAQVKGDVTTRNNTSKIKDVRRLLKEALC